MSVKEEAKRLLGEFPAKRHGPACAVGVSPHRALIEEMFTQCQEGRRVERIIREKFGDEHRLPESSVRRHMGGLCGCVLKK